MRLIFFILFLGFSLFSFSQNSTSIPRWATNIPKSNNKKMYAIGISDPKMDEAPAYRLALLRAKSMLALFRLSNVQQVVDFYESQKEQGSEHNLQKLEKLSKIFSKYVVDSTQIEVIEKDFNKDGEAIVLIKETLPKLDTARYKDTIKVECNSFLQEFKVDESSKSVGNYIMGVCEIKGRNRDSLKCYFECDDDNNVDFTVATTFNDSVYCTHSTMHEYDNTTSKIEATEFLGYSHLKKGLWKAYLDAILQNMISISNLMSSKTKNAGDAYKNDTNKNYESKDEHLTRGISSNTLSVSMKQIEIFQNKIWIKMTPVSYEKTPFQKKTEKIASSLKKSLDKVKGCE